MSVFEKEIFVLCNKLKKLVRKIDYWIIWPKVFPYAYFRNVYGRRCINILHIHSGFKDYSLFRYANGRLLDLFFFRIS